MVSSLSFKTADCTLTAYAIQTTPNQIVLVYEVVNISSQPLYLFNRLAKQGGSSVFNTDPNAVNIVFDGNQILVSKKLLPIPEDKEIERPYIPCLTRVEPHMLFRESIVLQAPLTPFTWYSSRPMRNTPVQHSLFFELGYTTASSQTEGLIQHIETEYGYEYVATWFPLELQSVLSIGPLLSDATIFSIR